MRTQPQEVKAQTSRGLVDLDIRRWGSRRCRRAADATPGAQCWRAAAVAALLHRQAPARTGYVRRRYQGRGCGTARRRATRTRHPGASCSALPRADSTPRLRCRNESKGGRRRSAVRKGRNVGCGEGGTAGPARHGLVSRARCRARPVARRLCVHIYLSSFFRGIYIYLMCHI
jgi:hypothetical protein